MLIVRNFLTHETYDALVIEPLSKLLDLYCEAVGD